MKEAKRIITAIAGNNISALKSLKDENDKDKILVSDIEPAYRYLVAMSSEGDKAIADENNLAMTVPKLSDINHTLDMLNRYTETQEIECIDDLALDNLIACVQLIKDLKNDNALYKLDSYRN